MKLLIDCYIEKYGTKEQAVNKAKWIEDLRIFGDDWYAHHQQRALDRLCRECGIVLRESDVESGECVEHQYARQ